MGVGNGRSGGSVEERQREKKGMEKLLAVVVWKLKKLLMKVEGETER